MLQVEEALTVHEIQPSAIQSMFKLSLFRSPSFILVCASSFVQLLGSFVPYVYLTGISSLFSGFIALYSLDSNTRLSTFSLFAVQAHAIQVGISKEAASFLLSIVGITNTVCRYIRKSDSIIIHNICFYDVK